MKCPGQDTRYWKPGDIFETECPNCGHKVEFFKDESTRKCRNCRDVVVNPKMDFGCAAYCKYAAECLGQLGPELLAKRDDLFKDRVAVEVKRLLGQDFQRISHAVKVARYVEEIGREEKAELAVLLCAAYLHVFSERDDAKGDDVERDGREILERLGAGKELIEKVLQIVRNFRAGLTDSSVNAGVLSDAHLLASLEGAKVPDLGLPFGMDLTERWATGTGKILASRLT
jgi:hypothetical protein